MTSCKSKLEGGEKKSILITYMQIYFLANVSPFLIEVSKKEGFKSCTLRQEFCSAITFVLTEKEQLLLEVTLHCCVFQHKVVWWEQWGGGREMQATAKKKACEVKLEYALMRTL